MPASIVSLLLLSFAVSLDGFGVGITYGIRKIRIPLKSVSIISLCSGLVILLSMSAGQMMTGWMSAQGASSLGAVILIGIGLWALIQFMRGGESPDFEASRDPSGSAMPAEALLQRTLWRLEIRQWGIIVQILRTPSAADVDRSGTISPGEAFLLGAALSLDAFAAGIGAGLVGFSPLPTAVAIAASSGLFLWVGTGVGFRASGWRWIRRLTVLPGLILIAMGLLKLI